MKSVENLRSYFQNELAADIDKVDKQRKMILTRLVATIIVFVAVIVLVTYSSLNFFAQYAYGWAVLFDLVIAVVGVIMINELQKNRDFYTDFKNLIIERIIQFINSSFVYRPAKYIPLKKFNESHLFPKPPNKKYKGDDYVSGSLGEKCKLEFSELYATRKEQKDDSGSTEQRTLFKGLFFVANVSSKFNGQAVIVPAEADFSNAEFIDKSQLEKLETGPASHSDNFAVYTNNTDEAQNLFTRELIHQLEDFRQRHQNDIRVSFIGNKIYVAISHDKDLFEPKLMKSLKDFDVIQEYYDDLYEAIVIVQLLSPQDVELEESGEVAANV
jgi:hypothetical protein